MTEQLQGVVGRPIDKADVDAAQVGFTISVSSSARLVDARRLPVAEAMARLVQNVANESMLYIGPLRLVLITGEPAEDANYWHRALGLPEAGLSNQPEAVAVGKHLSWGSDEATARSVIILADYVAEAAATGDPLGVSTIAHELGHVHDEFSRGRVLGFPESLRPPNLNDWPGICASTADGAWSEFAAESVGACYMTSENALEFLRNDSAHLEGVHKRLGQSITNYKQGKGDLTSLWSSAVTNIFNLFSNLGRAVAHLQLVADSEAPPVSLVSQDGEAACWSPVVERLIAELRDLGGKNYSDWNADPFCELRKVVSMGFMAEGFLPVHDGRNLRINLR